jgi:hypothetical protein
MGLRILQKITTRRAKLWTLKNLDNPRQVRSGQYTPQDYTENAGAKIPEVSTVNNQEPFPQWVGGEGETVSFTARIFRADPEHRSIRKDIEALKKATRKDPKLFRAPLFRFTWGAEIAFDCFVASVGGIRYDEVASDGRLKGAQFSVVLRRVENIPKSGLSKLNDPTGLSRGLKVLNDQIGEGVDSFIDVFGGSLHKKGKTVKAKEGDTFESIAATEYGDALVGDILRRAQPDKANLQPGDEVVLVDDTEIFQIKVTPQAVSLEDTETSRTVRELKFEARNRKIVKVF